jgi:hypothetical protein
MPSWRTTPVAPALAFGRQAGDVLIRYDFAGTQHEIRLPGAVWHGLAAAVRRRSLDRLGEQPTAWGPSGGAAARRDGYVHLAYGWRNHIAVRVPESIWEQISAAIRGSALDALPEIARDTATTGGPA